MTLDARGRHEPETLPHEEHAVLERHPLALAARVLAHALTTGSDLAAFRVHALQHRAYERGSDTHHLFEVRVGNGAVFQTVFDATPHAALVSLVLRLLELAQTQRAKLHQIDDAVTLALAAFATPPERSPR